MAEVDALQIKINADVSSAIDAIGRLNASLEGIRNNSSANTQAFNDLSASIKDFASSISSSIGDIERLASSLSAIHQAGGSVANVMSNISTSATQLGEGKETAFQDFTSSMERLIQIQRDLINENKKVKDSMKSLTASVKAATKPISKLVEQIGKIALYRMIRAAMTAIRNGFVEGAKNAALWSDAMQKVNTTSIHANQVMSQFSSTNLYLKDTFGSLAVSILNLVMPAFRAIVDIATKVADAINMVVSALGGATKYNKANPDYWNDYAKSMNKAGSAAKKSLMAFDEINKLQDNSSGSSSSGLDYSNLFKEVEIPSQFKELADMINEALNDINTMLATGIGLIAIGAILCLLGINIPLGIGLIIAGGFALAQAATLEYDKLPDELKKQLVEIEFLLGAFAFAIGLILALSGVQIPLGIALMAAGAINMYNAAKLDSEAIKKALQGALGGILGLVGAFAFAIGLMLTLTGMIPIGLALMAVGAIGIVAAIMPTDAPIKEKVSSVLKFIMQLAYASLIAVGLFLVVTGNLPMGLAVMAVGLRGVFKTWTVDDNPITRFVRQVVGDNETFIGGVIQRITGWLEGLSKFWSSITSAVNENGGIFKTAKSILGFASGGFPSAGSLFIANENGYGSEMIGAMGNRSVVANNQQIVDGIKSGVADAMMEVMMATGGFGGGSGQPVVENVFKVDSETLYRMVQKGQTSYNGRYHIVSEF